MKIVALTGAGISAPSGLRTFRDANGLWENHRIEDVATPEAFARNPELVLRFYNQRRAQLATVKPNAAHLALAVWERTHEVVVITQNVDDLHERAGSTRIIHLHGQLTQARCSLDPTYITDIGYRPIALGDRSPAGAQLRPHIVWFGENVPAMEEAEAEMETADAVVVIGTSLQVYPAAGLTELAPPHAHRFLVDPHPGRVPPGYHVIPQSADLGVSSLTAELGL
jgi:NAD-dependent protein deacetylases, SIR2 family